MGYNRAVVTAATRQRAARILAIVRRIPRGRVATYGQIAALAGLPRHARLVGRVLSELADERVPWQRVVNARGQISERTDPGYEQDVQRALLEDEGIEVRDGGRIDLGRFGWQPRRRGSATVPD